MCNQKCHPLHLISTKFYQRLRCGIAKTLEMKLPKYPPIVDYNDSSYQDLSNDLNIIDINPCYVSKMEKSF